MKLNTEAILSANVAWFRLTIRLTVREKMMTHERQNIRFTFWWQVGETFNIFNGIEYLSFNVRFNVVHFEEDVFPLKKILTNCSCVRLTSSNHWSFCWNRARKWKSLLESGSNKTIFTERIQLSLLRFQKVATCHQNHLKFLQKIHSRKRMEITYNSSGEAEKKTKGMLDSKRHIPLFPTHFAILFHNAYNSCNAICSCLIII
jgi:hypothetical protein